MDELKEEFCKYTLSVVIPSVKFNIYLSRVFRGKEARIRRVLNYPKNLFSSIFSRLRYRKLQIVKSFFFWQQPVSEWDRRPKTIAVKKFKTRQERERVAPRSCNIRIIRLRNHVLRKPTGGSLEGDWHDQIWCGLALLLRTRRRKFGVFNPPHVQRDVRIKSMGLPYPRCIPRHFSSREKYILLLY